MAEVFEAELVGELGFARKVAIKRMLGEAATDLATAQRFLDEARIASKLHHANIVAITDVGLLDGLPFQVLELVDGIDARQLQSAAGGKLPVEIALIVAADVAHALDHAHGARDAAGLPLGIVHRDVKPSNVLVSWGGDVKLTDFGIALARDRAAVTEAGIVPGTAGFIAPEQRTRSEVDGRADVFALGLMLHALITGYTPLQDISVEIQLLAGVPVPLDATLPADVKALIERAVAPERRARPTAAELADAIGIALSPRLTRDPRSYLRSFLEPLHGKRAKPGALDQLLGLEVVATGGDSEPHYEFRKTEVAAPKAIDAAPPAIGSSPDAASGRARPAPEPPRRARGWIAIAALAVAGGGGYAAWRFAASSGQTRAADAANAGAARDTGPLDLAVSDRSAPAIDAAPPPIDAPTLAIDAAVARDAAIHHGRDGGHAIAVVDAAVIALPQTTGYVQVFGEANVRMKILIDGKARGYAPNKIEVATGHHKLTVVRSDGTTPTVDIDVTDDNTSATPLRLSP